MDPHHRKIDLQSPLDLEYLSATINEAAQKKIDLHLPPNAQPSDDADSFQARVNSLVHQYVRETLHSALPSISINGLDATAAQLKRPSDASSAAEDSEERYEPYDPRLANTLRDLYAQLETETTKVAELRRDAPAKAAQTYLENLKEEMALREKEVEERRKTVRESAKESDRMTGLEGIEVKRQDKVQRAWDDAHGDLERLRGVTEAVAVLERAKTAASEVGVL